MEIGIIVEKLGSDTDLYPWFWQMQLDGDIVEENWSATKVQALQEAKQAISLKDIANT